ncbi:MAG: UDP-N-acetylmuramate dehydrogenase [Pseudomonadales bacterium]|nr:UDP-N-acetylmuramate dehydrogenase [Pseudomonadales bacterium]MCP5357382.1 UDP-N-acetylmuramate dehydrogenase [Pseudomonadales bacterium]
MIQEHVDLQSLNTFGLKASARYFCHADSEPVLNEALRFAQTRDLPLLVIGGGSNLLLREDFSGVVIRMALSGIAHEVRDDDSVCVDAASGENWHDFVAHCLAQGWYGLENLALIPGSVGAAPIQNIGAYGVEAGDFIESVRVLDIATGQQQTLSREACDFGYRDSVFKRSLRGNTLILGVRFRLWRQPQPNIRYAALAESLRGKQPGPQEIFDAVCAIRRSKLPDPAELGNAGSFFKNPVISAAHYARLQQVAHDIPGFVSGDGHSVKVPAAWLIERAGWKGRSVGGAAVYERQALVIVNRDHASAQDVVTLATEIMASVRQQFGVALEPEVQWVPPFSAT